MFDELKNLLEIRYELFRLIDSSVINFQILMNVLTEAIIAIRMLHATIMMVHLIALVILGTLEMVLIVKVSSGYSL